jgi:hypothetical protein
MERNLWDRLEDEPEDAFEAFTLFRGLRGRRAHELVADQLPHVERPVVMRWHRYYRWKARALAWDDYLDAQVQDAHKQDVINARLQQAEIATVGLEKIAKRVLSLDPHDIPIHNLPNFLQTMVNIQRLALGMSNQIIEVEDKRQDPATSSTAEKVFSSPEMVNLIDQLGERLNNSDQLVGEKPADG